MAELGPKQCLQEPNQIPFRPHTSPSQQAVGVLTAENLAVPEAAPSEGRQGGPQMWAPNSFKFDEQKSPCYLTSHLRDLPTGIPFSSVLYFCFSGLWYKQKNYLQLVTVEDTTQTIRCGLVLLMGGENRAVSPCCPTFPQFFCLRMVLQTPAYDPC